MRLAVLLPCLWLLWSQTALFDCASDQGGEKTCTATRARPKMLTEQVFETEALCLATQAARRQAWGDATLRPLGSFSLIADGSQTATPEE